MKQKWKHWSTQFEQLTDRERFLMALSVITISAVFLFILLIEPKQLAIKKEQQQMKSQKAEFAELQKAALVWQEKINVDPNQALHQELSDLAKRMAEVDSQIQQKTADLIPANKMASVLAAVLPMQSQLTLLGFESVAPAPLLELEQEYQDINLYRHGIRLQLSGRYQDVLDYMQLVETLPWKFLWGKLDYKVTEYPLATVELVLFSISAQKEFIGV